MYFPFFIPQHGGKRPAVQPQTIDSEFPLSLHNIISHYTHICKQEVFGHVTDGDASRRTTPSAPERGGYVDVTLWQRMAQRVWPLVLQVKRVRSQSPESSPSTSLGPTVSMEAMV